jgi:hypothetical protein
LSHAGGASLSSVKEKSLLTQLTGENDNITALLFFEQEKNTLASRGADRYCGRLTRYAHELTPLDRQYCESYGFGFPEASPLLVDRVCQGLIIGCR